MKPQIAPRVLAPTQTNPNSLFKGRKTIKGHYYPAKESETKNLGTQGRTRGHMKSSHKGEWIQDKRRRAVLGTNSTLRTNTEELRCCPLHNARKTTQLWQPGIGNRMWSAKDRPATKSTGPTLPEFHEGGLALTFFINITSDDDILGPKTSLSGTLLQSNVY